ncbi:hypothetical protein LCI18_008316 [Fusarium solani-melongenae]|uniref:Uncharacterized protein n=1 Tax=Fusarium solani subsp. cucurbitae TaxID=2747967 RepID=A0ACD3Z896_FUSSC|nr:hypothetical protein LCI18_008316 [Fusarium solani-melongenae]
MSFDTSDTSNEPRTKRIVMLISRSLSSATDNVLYTIGLATPSPTESLFHETENPEPLPNVVNTVCFATHLAVGVLDMSLWTNKENTLLQRMLGVTYWEHLGDISGSSINSGASSITSSSSASSSGNNKKGNRWEEKEIRSIKAIEIIGITTLCDDAILRNVFDQLMKGWRYLPSWWNCQDFAVHLAYLLCETEDACNTLVMVARSFRLQHVQRLSWEFSAGRWSNPSARASSTPIPFPENVGIDPFASSSFGLWSLTRGIKRYINRGKFKSWLGRLRQLEDRIPALEPFHFRLLEDWDLVQEMQT